MLLATLVIVLIVGAAVLNIGLYNGLISKRNRYKNAYAQIDVQLKRRYDLIPNLVETVRAYMKHEHETLEAVVRARNSAYGASQRAAESAGDPHAMQNLATAEGALHTVLTRVLALAEAYPDLKANQNLRDLTEELRTTENRVAFARQAYNDCVTSYNDARETFPAVMLADTFGFESAALLTVIEHAEERAAPKIAV